MISLKSEREIELIRQAGEILAAVLKELSKSVRSGITTQELDSIARKRILSYGAVPAFKGYRGFPGNICTSVNEEIIHGIPSNRQLRDGDIISLDVGVKFNNYFADSALTLPVGKISKSLKYLLHVTRGALYKGVKQAKKGNHLSDISWAIQEFVERHNLSIVKEFVGHGIGKRIHEEPEVPNFGQPGEGPLLSSGVVLAIEPMVNMGGPGVEILSDGWTAVTKDRKPSAHFEHTIAITKRGAQILTR